MGTRGKPLGTDRNLTSYGDVEFSRYLRRAFLASAGFDREDLDRPVVGIADTASDYTTCHRHMRELVEAVKRGVLEAGGLPLVFPTTSLGEIIISPTSMLYRNLMAMETEEMLRAYPMDAAVLLGGCDKTVPAQLMAAVSADVPAISLVTGPMTTGHWRGERLGACTDCRLYWARYRAGEIGDEEINEIRQNLFPSSGTCMVMGTASTMACLTEALGFMLSGGAAAPSGSADRLRIAVKTGREAVSLARSGVLPKQILTRSAFENAMKVLMAVGGSTNAVIHLTAIARRCRIELTLEDFNAASEAVPLLVDCKPAGKNFMEDFHRAGGVPVLLKSLAPLLDLSAPQVTGRTLGQLIEETQGPASWQSVIRTLEDPLGGTGSLTALKGTLAPDGAVVKRSAATASLLEHRGPAIVFESPEDVAARIDDPSLAITPDHVLVMRNGGPIAAGMPEAGSMPIPRYLAEKGVKDMLRISDARMSGTARGAAVLHCSPEAAAGGPLALVENGDLIEIEVKKKRLDLLVPEGELARRRASFRRPALPDRGWRRLSAEHVLQAHLGADLDFLAPL